MSNVLSYTVENVCFFLSRLLKYTYRIAVLSTADMLLRPWCFKLGARSCVHSVLVAFQVNSAYDMDRMEHGNTA